MPTIIVDQSKYHVRTNRIPPKRGQVRASFWVNDVLVETENVSYESAINHIKRMYARPAGIHTIVLEDVHAI